LILTAAAPAQVFSAFSYELPLKTLTSGDAYAEVAALCLPES
jgi:hypothetical protein